MVQPPFGPLPVPEPPAGQSPLGQAPLGQPAMGWMPEPWSIPARPPVLPVVQREYHEFYRTPAFRWWRPLAAIGMFAATWFVAILIVSLAGLAYDYLQGDLDVAALARGEVPITPALFLANNVGIALAIPLAWAAHRAVFGQRIGWLSSIQGSFRWRAFWRFLAVTVPLYLVGMGIELALGGVPDLKLLPETWFLLASVVLTTPLQCAGEEYSMRGLGARAIGSWFPSRRVGLVVATAITSLIFMLLHGAGDPWLNLFYVAFAVCASYLVWRTGGLEAPIALHVVNNLSSMLLLPFMGVDGIFDRGTGAGSPWVLLQVVIVLGATALIMWQARRLGLPTTAAPADPRGTATY